MTTVASPDLIAELEVAPNYGPAERRVRTLQWLSELLLSSAERPPGVPAAASRSNDDGIFAAGGRA
jgi:hypothetical protein